jgi:hypothetical protein
VVRDTRAHPGVAAEERVHAVLVPGQDHHQVVALVFHRLQQDLDRLGAVVALVLGLVQIVRLVDEQHAPHGPLQHLSGLGRGVTDVLSDQVVARDRDHLGTPDVAQAVQDLRHAQGDRGLAGARVAGEAHVQRRRPRRQAELAAHAVHQQQRGGFVDAGLDRLQADQLALEAVEHLAHVGRAQFVGEVNVRIPRGVRRCQRGGARVTHRAASTILIARMASGRAQ